MSLVVIPALNAAEADAPLVECAPNMEELIPAFSRISRNHLAMELEVTALCGLINEMNSLLSPLRKGAVLFTYSRRVLTGQSAVLVGKEGKKKGSIRFPCRDCFARESGKKDTPFERGCILWVSREQRSIDLDGRVIANKNTALYVRSFKESSSELPSDSIKLNTVCTSHVSEYLGTGGLSLYTPFSSLVMIGC